MTFIDSNVPMYLVGAPHPHQDRSLALVTRLVQEGERLATDVEVYQEILHRYTAIHRPDAIDAAFKALDAIADDIQTFGMPEIYVARSIIDSIAELSARDALPIAVMRKASVSRILSFDSGFDASPGIERIS